MTLEHPRWEEFTERLEGPEGCDFKEDENKRVTWHCGGGKDKTLAEAILNDMGFSEGEITDALSYFDEHGGHCDCEILFNVAC